MENLRGLAHRLYEKLPSCGLCNNTVYEVKVYAAFSCLHIICFQCAHEGRDERCPRCVEATLLNLDYRRLETVRRQLVEQMKALAQGNSASFPDVFEFFYRLISLFSGSELLPVAPDVLPKMQIESKPLPLVLSEELSRPKEVSGPGISSLFQPSVGRPSVPVYQPQAPIEESKDFPALPIQREKCSCGKSKPKGRNCSCGYQVIDHVKKCETCQETPCTCVDIQSKTQLWDCWKCGYEYNYVKDSKCVNCGRVISGPGYEKRGKNERYGKNRKRKPEQVE